MEQQRKFKSVEAYLQVKRMTRAELKETILTAAFDLLVYADKLEPETEVIGEITYPLLQLSSILDDVE